MSQSQNCTVKSTHPGRSASIFPFSGADRLLFCIADADSGRCAA